MITKILIYSRSAVRFYFCCLFRRDWFCGEYLFAFALLPNVFLFFEAFATCEGPAVEDDLSGNYFHYYGADLCEYWGECADYSEYGGDIAFCERRGKFADDFVCGVDVAL